MTISWATDLHLDRGSSGARDACLASLSAVPGSFLLITGDISNSTRLTDDLEALASRSGKPVYFVLGNHDHYGSSIARVRDEIITLTERNPRVQWLPRAEVVRVDRATVMVGVDGWGDGRVGNALTTPLVLNDDRLIVELAVQDTRAAKVTVRRVLADADAARLAALLYLALQATPRRIIVATHLPPFLEAIRPGSRADHPHWHPLLVCGAAGAVLRATAENHPEVELLVLCGHTHAPHQAQLLPNLEVRVGKPRELVQVG